MIGASGLNLGLGRYYGSGLGKVGGVLARRTMSNSATVSKPRLTKYDAVIVGGGHNGLVSAAYLAKNGMKVCVLERRHVLGGAAVTEEIVPGFKFSRASYCLSLLRPVVMKELELLKHGLKLLPRNPSTFSPLLDGRYLMMGPDEKFNHEQVSKFSRKDADALVEYEKMLERIFSKLDPLIDYAPFDPNSQESPFKQLGSTLKAAKAFTSLGKDIVPFLEVCTAPAIKILNRWFESEPLIGKLATDAVTGAMVGPSTPGSGYVLFHHCMGDVGYGRGIWTYVEGGMGAVSAAIAKAASSAGAELVTNAPVKSVIVTPNGATKGVVLVDGTEVNADYVLSNCDPYTTYKTLLDENDYKKFVPDSVKDMVNSYDYSSATFKINVALDRLPNFKAFPSKADGTPGPSHTGTIHFLENVQQLEDAYTDAVKGIPSRRPFIEMTIPSSLDKTISPEGKHVALLFCQYAPYKLASGSWDDPGRREDFAKSVYKVIEEYIPGFTDSIIGADLLSPLDLERTFGLKGGNIFHGSMGLDQLYWLRPFAGFSRYKTPVKGYYICGSGAHPGGGVMGASGRNAAFTVLADSHK